MTNGGALMEIVLDRDSGVPAYVQIRNQIRDGILRGDLPAGMRLPPERMMARNAGVSRTTVVNAYNELMAEGLVEAHVGRGTTVIAPPEERAQPMAWPAHFSALGQRVHASSPTDPPALQQMCEFCEQPDVAYLASGIPPADLLPMDRVRQAWQAALPAEGLPDEWLDAGPQGLEPLREAIAERLGRRGIATSADAIVMLHGAHQGLDLLVRLLAEPGDAVLCEAPAYRGALEAFRVAGLRVIGVPVDGGGMLVDQVEPLLARHRPKFIYTVPTFQNPTGATLTSERRRHLLALAQRYQVPIVEDDPFGELAFGDAPPPIKALDRSGHVLYLGTVSKVLTPALRVGWLVAPEPVTDAVTDLRWLADIEPGLPGQALVLEFMRRRWLDEHVAAMRTTYASRMRALDAALRRHLPEARWTAPGGGLNLWVELPVSAADLLPEAGRRGVVFLPGHILYPGRGPDNVCRLTFADADEATLERAASVLGTAVRAVLRRPEARAAPVSPVV